MTDFYNSINWSNIPKPDAKKLLNEYKIVTRNVLFITGIPNNLCNEELLASKPYLGQYGQILRISINRTKAKNGKNGKKTSCNNENMHEMVNGDCHNYCDSTFSAYVTFVDTFSCCLALLAIQYCENVKFKTLRAYFGTTKFCRFFLKGVKCNIRYCSFAHYPAKVEHVLHSQNLTSTKLQKLQKEFV